MERKHQFLGFAIVFLIFGFLTYFRKIVSKHNFTKYGKFLYLTTMMILVVSIMLLLYFTDLNNLLSFCIGLFVTIAAEYLAQFLIFAGDVANPFIVKIIKKTFGVDLSNELTLVLKDTENEETPKQH